MRRLNPVIEAIEILIATDEAIATIFDETHLILQSSEQEVFKAKTENETPVKIYRCALNQFGSKQFWYTGTKTFIDAFLAQSPIKTFKNIIF